MVDDVTIEELKELACDVVGYYNNRRDVIRLACAALALIDAAQSLERIADRTTEPVSCREARRALNTLDAELVPLRLDASPGSVRRPFRVQKRRLTIVPRQPTAIPPGASLPSPDSST